MRNLRNGRAKVCRVDETLADEHLTSSVADPVLEHDGSVAWTGLRPVPVEFGPVVLIDEGEAVDLPSLRLRGSTVTWLHAGEARSAILR